MLSTMVKSRQKRDPNARREAKNYDRPIASREWILEFLETQSGPLVFELLCDGLNLSEEIDRHALTRRLNAMARDGQLYQNRGGAFGIARKMDLIRGRVIAHRNGYGFLAPDESGGDDDLFLSPKEMRALMHGDEVLVRVSCVDQRGRQEVSVVEVLARHTTQVVGRLYRESGTTIVVPDNPRINQEVVIAPKKRAGAKHGQFVVVELVEQPTKHSQPVGHVIEVIGEHMAPGMEIDVAIRSHGLPTEWPDEIETELKSIGRKVPKSAAAGRLDLRELALVTIDGADAKDFDDAIYCEASAKGWKLYVAIADVSEYVKPGMALDVEAKSRGTSVYFPERVIPMLPEALSNGLCSLKPDRDRLCMVCVLSINRKGMVTRAKFSEAIMHSHARLTYDKVAAILVSRREKVRKKYADLVPHLEELHALYGALREARQRRGAIDLDTVEAFIVLDGESRVEKIVPRTRNDAHRIIEECMVTANVAAAEFLASKQMPLLYRVHDKPKAAKVTELNGFLAGLGLKLPGGEVPEPRDYLALVHKMESLPAAGLLQTVLLRSLSQAVYSPKNLGHFGLALANYAHFTSPIRRYPDLLVHRAIRHVLRGGTPEEFVASNASWEVLGQHCSTTERRADEAARDVVAWLKCEYMLDKIGDTFEGVVTGVASFGLFVHIEQLCVDGLVHVSTLGSDYFHFDPQRYRLEGERSGAGFGIADRVNIKVVKVSLDDRTIDFELTGNGKGTRVHGRRQRSGILRRGRRAR
jgi:ribonuclease R